MYRVEQRYLLEPCPSVLDCTCGHIVSVFLVYFFRMEAYDEASGHYYYANTESMCKTSRSCIFMDIRTSRRVA